MNESGRIAIYRNGVNALALELGSSTRRLYASHLYWTVSSTSCQSQGIVMDSCDC